jgi:hypothetical protein
LEDSNINTGGERENGGEYQKILFDNLAKPRIPKEYE